MRRLFVQCLREIEKMPIYEYKCDSCGHELEAFQKLSDDLLVTCPQCHQDALRKKVSAAGFRLKGGGWYETDFKSGKKKNVAGGEAGTASSSDSSASDSAGSSSASSSSDSSTSSSSKSDSSKSD